MFFIGQRVAVTVPNDIAWQPLSPDDRCYPMSSRPIPHRICDDMPNNAEIQAVCEVVACANHDTDNPAIVVSVEAANCVCIVVPAGECCPIVDGRVPYTGPNPYLHDMYVGPHDIDDFIHDYTDNEQCAWEHDFASEDEYDDEPTCGDDDDTFGIRF